MKSKFKNLGYYVAGTMLLGGLMFSSCKKNSSPSHAGPKPPTNPGGYDSSNQIASASLTDFWSFNGNVNDTKGSLSGTNNGGTYITGMQSGTQAWQGSSATYSYITYPNAGNALSSLTSFTLSVWINGNQPVPNPGATPAAGLGEQAFFQLANDSAWQSNIHIGLAPFTSVAGGVTTPNSDTLQLKVILSNFSNGIQWGNYYVTAYLDTAVSKWTNVIVTYSAASSTLNVYENGTAVPINGPYTTYPGVTGGLKLYMSDPGSVSNVNNATGWGSLVFKNVSGVVIGAWSVNTTPALSVGGIQPWAGNYTGAMERLRVYNTALSASDANSLYILEKAGF
ncbi:MAG TPA: hypothetical protein VNE41_00565 [Chitinophagaceae bacterium]|nr:hypothetical protein [Chitinophagaceae bacterium]